MPDAADWHKDQRRRRTIRNTLAVVGLLAASSLISVAASCGVAGSLRGEIAGKDTGVERQVGAFGEAAVVTWLTATANNKNALDAYLTAPEAMKFPGSPAQVESPQVWSVDPTHHPVYSVVVQAMVKFGLAPMSVRWFQVSVFVAPDTTMRVQGLPAEYTPKNATTGYNRQSDYGQKITKSTDPLAPWAKVQGFLSALLTKDGGDLSLFVSDTAAAALRKSDPPPYQSVVLEELAATDALDAASPKADEEYPVLATANAGSAGLNGLTLQYPLRIRFHDSKWEVTQIDAVLSTGDQLTKPQPATPTVTTSPTR